MLRLHSIEISRFRGIHSGRVEDFADVNLLIGRNNSGKSTIAEAITIAINRLSSGAGRDPLDRNPAEIWNEIRKTQRPQPESWYKMELSRELRLTVIVGEVTFSLSQHFRAGVRESAKPDIRSQADHAVRQFSQRLSLFRPWDASNQDIENVLWQQLLAKRRDKDLTKAINHIFDMDAEQFQLLPDRRLMVLFSDHSLPLDVQGDGARAALRCLMMLTALQGTLLILEEPECYQHPGSLERFALAICRQAKEQEVQLLISTHSADCVGAFLRAARGANSESAVFHLKLEDGDLDAKRLDSATVETLQSTGVDVRYLDLYA